MKILAVHTLKTVCSVQRVGAVRPARVLYVLYLYSLCGLVLSTVGRAFVSIWLVRVLRPADRSFTPLGAGLRAVGLDKIR